MNTPWRSWWFWKGVVFILSASTSLVLTYLQNDGTELLEVIWESWLHVTWLDISELEYDADAIAPFYAGFSALAFLTPLLTEQSQKSENERAFDFGLRIWGGVAAFITAVYWLSAATDDKAIKHLVALTPLIPIVGLMLAMYFLAMISRQNRMSQSQGINEEAQDPPKSELGPTVAGTDQVGFLFADARALYDDALEMLGQGNIRNAAEKAWGATKRATDALVLARIGEEPQTTALTTEGLLALARASDDIENLVGRYFAQGLREIIEGPYRMIYPAGEQQVDVLAVVHGSRLLPPEL